MSQNSSDATAAINSIRKRDGRAENFNSAKITKAIHKAGQATGESSLRRQQHDFHDVRG